MEGGWFTKKRNESKFNKLLEKYKKSVNKLEDDY